MKLLAAQAQGMYWFLVMRSDLEGDRDDVSVVRGRRIGAAPWVDLGLKQLVIDAGVDLGEVDIAPVPGAVGAGTNFGLTAARALADGKIDGFWANGMGAEVALRSGAGTRGAGRAAAATVRRAASTIRSPRLAATEAFVRRDPGRAAAVVRALRRRTGCSPRIPSARPTIGERIFPAEQAALIAELVRRDVPYLRRRDHGARDQRDEPVRRARGLLEGDPPYEQIVAMDIDRS